MIPIPALEKYIGYQILPQIFQETIYTPLKMFSSCDALSDFLYTWLQQAIGILHMKTHHSRFATQTIFVDIDPFR